MLRYIVMVTAMLLAALGPLATSPSSGKRSSWSSAQPDPHGSPRPFRDARDVPLRTSLYLELATPPGAKAGEVSPDSVSVSLQPGRRRGRRAAAAGPPVRRGCLGVAAAEERPLGRPVARRLHRAPRTAESPRRDTPRRCARRPARAAGRGRDPPADVAGTWSFTTEAAEPVHRLAFPLDLGAEPVRWHGRFFSGVCNVIFCSQAANYGPTYELMAEARKQHPRAWSYQRDFWPTGTEFRPPSSFLAEPTAQHRPRARDAPDRRDRAARGERRAPRRGRLRPRAVRHPGGPIGRRGLPPRRRGAHRRRRPRRPHEGPRRRRRGRHGHRRPLRDPARRLEDRLRRAAPRAAKTPTRRGCFRPAAATSASSARTARRVITGAGSTRSGTWSTAGTAAGLMVNFADATGDLARDGRSWTTVKDLAQWHDVARTIAGHIIDRYGADVARLHLERLQRARPGRPLLAGELGRAAGVLRLHDRRHPAGLRGPRLRLEQGLHRRPGAGRDLRHEPAAPRVPRPLLAPRAGRGRAAAERRGGRPPARRQAVAAGRGALPRPRRQGEPVRLRLDPLLQPLGDDGRQADQGQGDGPGDRPGLLREALGQLARVVPRLDAAARRGGGRLLPGQRLLPRAGAPTSCTASSSGPRATPAMRTARRS